MTDRVRGMPTLNPGSYTGVFVGATPVPDSDDHVVILTVKNTDGHVERTDIDTGFLAPLDQVQFTIAMRNGPMARLNGNRLQLWEDNKPISDWFNVTDLYTYVQENGILLAEPKITSI